VGHAPGTYPERGFKSKAGTYLMQVDSMTEDLGSYLYTVNGGPPQTINSGGGSFFLTTNVTVPVNLHAGLNVIQFGNPTSNPPDLDRIVISGNGDATVSPAITYAAEAATLGGSVTAGFSNYSSGLFKAGNIGAGAANNVSFSNVTVPSSGTYQVEIDYQTRVRSFFLSINDGAPIQLDLNGSSFNDPAVTIIPVQLKPGVNTIQIGNPSGYAPDLHRIVVAPPIPQTTN
jgi:alpha-galactosidase